MVSEKKIQHPGNKRKDIVSLLILLAIIILVNFVGFYYFKRFDLTSEKRYTLAASTKKLLQDLDDEIYLKVYLSGDFNPGFTRLKNETREILDEFRAYSDNKLQYDFITPGEGLTKDETTNLERQLYKKGIMPEQITDKANDKTTRTVIWPGAIVSLRDKEAAWQIFTRQTPGIDAETSVNNSVQELEYSLTNVIRKLQRTKKAEVTFIQGHGEADTLAQYDFMRTLSEYYNVNTTEITKGRELTALKGSDAIVITQPDSSFTDKEKFIIDQYIMNGGKVLWLIDPVFTSIDSLQKGGFTIGINRPLNIEDMLFKYGVRLNPVLVQDLQCGYLNMNVGFQGGQAQMKLFPWLYSPLVLPDVDHPIVKNLDLIKFDYLSTLDTVTARGIKKTILLKTSRYTKTQPTPARVYLRMAEMRPKESQFINSYQSVACLLEGEFSSFVEYRLPNALLSDSNFKYLDKSKKTKMIVVADGDVAQNAFQRSTGQVFPLGFDRNTKQTFANKIFLLNCVNYLLDDEGLLQLRSREVKLRLLNKKKIDADQRGKWQMINVGAPLLLILAFAVLQFYLRKRKFGAR